MKYAAVLTAIFGVCSMVNLKATTAFDLIIGFTQEGKNTSGNDLYVDIGPVNPYPGQPGLLNGETWNLGSSLSAQGFNLGGTNTIWGIVGDAGTADGANPETLWVTTAGFVPPKISGPTYFSSVDVPLKSIEVAFGDDGQSTWSNPGNTATPSSSAYNSWNEEAINGTLGSQFINIYGISPVVVGTNSVSTLWQVYDTNSTPTTVGTFKLSAGGVLTFNTISTATPPAPRIVNITRVGNTSTIFFTTTNGSFTYSLHFTNVFTGPLTNWPASSTTVTGNGLTNSLTDTTSTTNRFYYIGVH